jgi:hypothetical protein
VGDVLCRSLLYGSSLVEAVEALLDVKSRIRFKVKKLINREYGVKSKIEVFLKRRNNQLICYLVFTDFAFYTDITLHMNELNTISGSLLLMKHFTKIAALEKRKLR